MKDVYLVHCIDTEGPLYESLDATFDRIEQIYGLKFDASEEILRKLQRKELPAHGYESAIANMVSPARLNLKKNWTEISKMLETIQSKDFRTRLLDSDGGGWIYSWFCLDHVGFKGENPRRRDVGHHKVFDFYTELTTASDYSDIVQWHYHPIPYNGNFHGSGTAYLNSQNIWTILGRKIIDRNWFPSAYRPGFHIERPDSHWFLEQWIPFDYGNQAMSGIQTDQPDLLNGRAGDWRRAPDDWSSYHPAHDDYQTTGHCRRWIMRCLNMEARLREINQNEMDKGFARASQGLPTIIAYTNHDFRDMPSEIEKIRSMIENSSKKFSDVKFHYTNALTAVRRFFNLTPKEIGLTVELERSDLNRTSKITIRCQNKIFGPQPFIAIETYTGDCLWENLDFDKQNEWSFTFDANHINYNVVKQVGVAANSPEGAVEVVSINMENGRSVKRVVNQ